MPKISFSKRADEEGIIAKAIETLVGETFEIKTIEIQKGLEYETAVFETTDGNSFRTSSEILVRQLKKIADWLKEDETNTVEVTLAQVGRYYTFK